MIDVMKSSSDAGARIRVSVVVATYYPGAGLEELPVDGVGSHRRLGRARSPRSGSLPDRGALMSAEHHDTSERVVLTASGWNGPPTHAPMVAWTADTQGCRRR